MTKERYQELAAEENGKSINQGKKDIITTTGSKVYYFVPKGTTIYHQDDAQPRPYANGVTDRPQYIQTTTNDADGEYLTLSASNPNAEPVSENTLKFMEGIYTLLPITPMLNIGGWSKNLVLKEDCRKVTAQEYQNAQAWMTATENGMKSCQHDLQDGTLKKTLHDFFYETQPHKLGAQEERPKTSSMLIIAACIAIVIFIIAKARK